DDLVDHAVWIGLRSPAKIIDRLCPVALSAGVDLVDGADLARLGLGDKVFVVKPPPCRRVAAERLAGIGRIGAGPGLYVHNPDFQDVPRLRTADIDRAGADVHPKSLAGAAAKQLAVYWASAAAINALLIFCPKKHTFGTRIAFNHTFGVVIGVVR